MVANSAEEEEQRILDTYEPAPVHESDSDADDTPVAPVISYKVAFENLQGMARGAQRQTSITGFFKPR